MPSGVHERVLGVLCVVGQEKVACHLKDVGH